MRLFLQQLCFGQINFILRILYLIRHFEMKDQICEEGSLHRAILHQTKEKYKELNSSLLLTSSLISHKQKISQNRKQSNAFPLLPSCKGLLKASKMNIQEVHCLQEQNQKIHSNIQELKFLARKLQQQQMTKLGKQNKKKQKGEIQIIAPLCQTEIAINKDFNKKPNKRKIVKGRPEMHVFIKKRKFLNALLQEDKQPQNQCNKGKFRQTINEILNKNNLLKFITKNKVGNRHLYDNLVQEKQEDLAQKTQSKIQGSSMRNSAVCFKNIEKSRYLNRLGTKEEEDAKQPFPIKHFSLGHKRYSASQTIQ